VGWLGGLELVELLLFSLESSLNELLDPDVRELTELFLLHLTVSQCSDRHVTRHFEITSRQDYLKGIEHV
jgi:hypothetical protein